MSPADKLCKRCGYPKNYHDVIYCISCGAVIGEEQTTEQELDAQDAYAQGLWDGEIPE